MKKISKLLFNVSFVCCIVVGVAACGGDGYTKGLEYTLYGVDKNGEGGMYGVSGIGAVTNKDIVIPPTYNDLPVITIDGWVFANNSNIKRVTININTYPYDCAYTVNINSFTDCPMLEEVIFLRENGYLTIENEAFADCSKLYKVNADMVGAVNLWSYIGINAFQNCISLEELIISPFCIAENAFSNCPNLKTLYFHGTKNDWEIMNTKRYDQPVKIPPLNPEGNEDLLNAKIYFYSETQPEDSENSYWHYLDGEAVVW